MTRGGVRVEDGVRVEPVREAGSRSGQGRALRDSGTGNQRPQPILGQPQVKQR